MSRPADISADVLIAVLGAGQASRFGADKLTQVCAGKPLGQWALEAAKAMGLPLIWVCGEHTPGFVDCETAANPDAAQGIGTSVACAARLAMERGASALLIMLADMPLVTPGLLARLIAAGGPAACRYPQGHAGVPALLPAGLFGQIAALRHDQGAGALLRDLPGLNLLDCTARELFDVDRPQALAEAERLLKA